MLSLRAYEMAGEPYAPVVLPTSEPAFVIIAGMMMACDDYGSEGRE